MPPDSNEQHLIAAISAGDTASFAVYADLLEERGEDDRAEFLRLGELLRRLSAFDPRYTDCEVRYRELEASLDPTWRAAMQAARVVAPGEVATHEPSRRGGFSLSELLAWVFGRRQPREARPFELPEQLRYLERLPAVAAPAAMVPRRR